MIPPDEVLYQKMEPVFQDRGEPATYGLYLDTSREDSANTDEYQEFDITVLTGKRNKWTTGVAGPQMQELAQSFIFREKDFPDGITFKDLSANDYIKLGGDQFDVGNHKNARPFIRCEAKSG
jgi:hypothetical protein